MEHCPEKLEEECVENKKPPVSDLFLKTDLHGLAEFYEANKWTLKAMWLLIIIATYILLTIELYECITDFYNNPILTTYSLIADPTGMEFPEVYICPSNGIHRETRRKSNIDLHWEQRYVSGHYTERNIYSVHLHGSELDPILGWKSTSSSEHGMHAHAIQAMEQCYNSSKECWKPKDLQDYFLSLGYPMDTFIKECAFNGAPINCSQSTNEVFDSSYKKCFLIRIPKKARQKVAGVGLSLVLDLDINNAYPTSDVMHMQLPHPFADGVSVRVDKKFDIASQEWTLVPSGTHTKLGLELTKACLLETTDKDGKPTCVEDEFGSQKLKVFNGEIYSSGLCEQDCLQQLAQKECKCIMPIDKQFLKQELVYCNRSELEDCAFPSIYSETKFLDDCMTHCAVTCSFQSYAVQLSSHKYPASVGKEDKSEVSRERPKREDEEGRPTKGTFNIGRRPKNRITPPPPPAHVLARKSRKNLANVSPIIVLDIAFSDLQYTEIRQEKSMTLSTFIGNIGGHIGLWVGASIVTLIKFVLVLLSYCVKGLRSERESEDL